MGKSPKRLFTDPALAVAALAASAGSVAQDKEAMGFLFESIAIRDLRVYAQSLGARLYNYGESNGLKADAVIEGLDGQWAAVEIKLGGGKPVAEACESLRAVRSQIDTTRCGEPARLIVFTAFGHGNQTHDGIADVGVTALKP